MADDKKKKNESSKVIAGIIKNVTDASKQIVKSVAETGKQASQIIGSKTVQNDKSTKNTASVEQSAVSLYKPKRPTLVLSPLKPKGMNQLLDEGFRKSEKEFYPIGNAVRTISAKSKQAVQKLAENTYKSAKESPKYQQKKDTKTLLENPSKIYDIGGEDSINSVNKKIQGAKNFQKYALKDMYRHIIPAEATDENAIRITTDPLSFNVFTGQKAADFPTGYYKIDPEYIPQFEKNTKLLEAMQSKTSGIYENIKEGEELLLKKGYVGSLGGNKVVYERGDAILPGYDGDEVEKQKKAAKKEGRVYIPYWHSGLRSDGSKPVTFYETEAYNETDVYNAVEFMTTDEYFAFLYLYDKYGTDVSYEYVSELPIADRVQNYRDSHGWERYYAARPVEAFLGHRAIDLITPVEGLYGGIKTLAGADVTMNETIFSRGQEDAKEGSINSTDVAFLKGLYGFFNIAGEEAPEIIAETYLGPAAGYIISAGAGASDKLAEQAKNGTLNSFGSRVEVLISSGMDVIGYNLINKGAVKAVSPMIKNVPNSATKQVLEFGSKVLGGEITAVGGTLIDFGANRLLQGEDSNYKMAYNAYRSQGLSHEEASDKALNDTLYEGLKASFFTGMGIGAVHGLPVMAGNSLRFKIIGAEARRKNASVLGTIEDTSGFNQKSEAYKNAQLLKTKLETGKQISDTELGAQIILNKQEKYTQARILDAYEKLTGLGIYVGKLEDFAEAVYDNGKITLTSRPEADVVDTVAHDVTHALKNNKWFKSFVKQVQLAVGYDDAVNRVRQKRAEAGLADDSETAEFEVAADFAINLSPKTLDEADRLLRMVQGNTTIYDRVYTKVRDLGARLKAIGGREYVDEVTGLRIKYDDLVTARRALENALITAKEYGYSEGSPMYRLKNQNDTTKYGVSVEKAVTEYAGKVGMNKKLWNADTKARVKDLVRSGFDKLKAGDSKGAEADFETAGAIISNNAKQQGVSVSDAFAKAMTEKFNEGKDRLALGGKDAASKADKSSYGYSINKYTYDLMGEYEVPRSTRNEPEEAAIRQSLDALKSGDKKTASVILKDLAKEMLKRVERGISDRDKEVLAYIRKSHMDLEGAKNSGEFTDGELERLRKITGSTTRAGSNNIKPDQMESELADMFPEYFKRAEDGEGHKSIERTMLDVYDRIINTSQQRKYTDFDIENMSDEVANRITDDYYLNQPAAAETPQERKSIDEKKYGMDVEGTFRGLYDDITEGEVLGAAELVRTTVDEFLNSDGSFESADDIFTRISETVGARVGELLKGKGRTDIEKGNMASTVIRNVDDSFDKLFCGQETKAQSEYAKAVKSGDESRIEKARKNQRDIERKKQNAKTAISRLLSNTMEKTWVSEEVRTMLGNKSIYTVTDNKTTFDMAIREMSEDGIDRTKDRLLADDAWDAVDAVKAGLIMQKYDAQGDHETAVLIYERFRAITTRNAQMLQSISMLPHLSVESQILSWRRDRDRSVEKQFNKYSDPKRVKKERDSAVREDENFSRHANDVLMKTDEEYSNNKHEAENLRDELLDANEQVHNDENQYNDAMNNVRDIETQIKEIEDSVMKRSEAVKKIREYKEKLEKATKAEKRELKKQIKEAEQIKSEIDRLTALKSEYETKLKTAKEQLEGSRAKSKELQNKIRSLDRQIKKTLKSFEKEERKRQGKDKTALEEFYEKYKIKHIDRTVEENMEDALRVINELTDAPSLRDLIIKQAAARKMTIKGRLPNFIMSKLYTGEEGVAVLKHIATQQVFGMIADAEKHTWGKVLTTIGTVGQLLNPKTILRNIIGNFVFNGLEIFTNDLAALGDVVLGAATKQRGIGFEIPFTGWKNAAKRAGKAYLETALNVDLIDSSSEYRPSNTRAFKSRLGSGAERIVGYTLNVTDEWKKGQMEHRIGRSLKNTDFTDEQRAAIVEAELKRRTFQDESSVVSRFLSDQKTALNNFGIGERDGDGHFYFGLGTYFNNYVTVSGNLFVRSLEYSPLGAIKTVRDIGSTAREYYLNRRMNKGTENRSWTPAMQRKLLLSISRTVTGTALTYAGYWLTKQGIIIIGEADDDEYSKKKYEQAKGISDIQINWSALGRLIGSLNGGLDYDSEMQHDDTFMDINWLQPLNGPLSAGAELAKRTSGGLGVMFSGDMVKSSLNMIPDLISDMSMFYAINGMVQNYENSGGDFSQFVLATLADLPDYFYPTLLRNYGKFVDDKTRNPYAADSLSELMSQKFFSDAPVMMLRDKVPVKLDIYGEEVSDTLGSAALDFFNSMIAPGAITKYKKNPLTDELDILLQYSDEILPKTPYKGENKIEIDGQYYSFRLEGKAYEDYSGILGQTTYKAMLNFMTSEDYELLSVNQRIETLEKISKGAADAVKEQWAAYKMGASKEEVLASLSEFTGEYSDTASGYVLKRQAQELVSGGDVAVEKYFDISYKRPYTEEEKQDGIEAQQKIISQINNGTRYKSKKSSDGKTHKVYVKDWEEGEKEAEIAKARETIDKIESGIKKKEQQITGKWSELTEYEQNKVSDYIENNPDKIILPDDVLKNKPDMSGEGYYEDTVIDITNGLPGGKEAPKEQLRDKDFKADHPDEISVDSGNISKAKTDTKADETIASAEVQNGLRKSTGTKTGRTSAGAGGSKSRGKSGGRTGGGIARAEPVRLRNRSQRFFFRGSVRTIKRIYSAFGGNRFKTSSRFGTKSATKSDRFIKQFLERV